MPKNNKKRGASKKAGGMSSRPPTDDENSTGDNWSTASVVSDNSSIFEAGSGEEQPQEVDETTEQENFEDRLCDCIEGLSAKSGPQRKKALDGLTKAFCKKYIAEFLEKRKETVTDTLLKCVKRGKTEEQTQAAKCIGLLALTLGSDLEGQYDDIQVVLSNLLADNSASVPTRSWCATALSICCFVTRSSSLNDLEELRSKMSLMEDLFKKLYRGEDGALPQCNQQYSELYTSCLEAWCLLLTRTPDFFVQLTAQSHIKKLGDILLMGDTDLRIAAGEAIALLYEMNRYIDDEFGTEDPETEKLCNQLRVLSVEGTKHIARNALRQQRSRFRDILQTVQDWEFDDVTVKISKMESLVLGDWSTRVRYNAICSVLHSGINVHFQENIVLRELFEMGAPLPVGAKPVAKMSKVQRKYYNSQADKARTLLRSKSRDKRSAVGGF